MTEPGNSRQAYEEKEEDVAKAGSDGSGVSNSSSRISDHRALPSGQYVR